MKASPTRLAIARHPPRAGGGGMILYYPSPFSGEGGAERRVGAEISS